MNDIAEDPNKSKIKVSLNCLRKRSQSGSAASCGSSFDPYWRSRDSASDCESPCDIEECKRDAVSSGDSWEKVEVMDEAWGVLGFGVAGDGGRKLLGGGRL